MALAADKAGAVKTVADVAGFSLPHQRMSMSPASVRFVHCGAIPPEEVSGGAIGRNAARKDEKCQ